MTFMSDSPEGRKRCPDCGMDKAVSDFSRNAARPDGLQFYCKQCFATRSARTYRERQRRKGKTVRERVEVPEGHKFCPGCRAVKLRTEWHRRTSSPDGLNVYCKACSKNRSRRDYLKRTFGLTPHELDSMIEMQGGVCALCRRGQPEHIDHDHASGRVRGVLCGPCNMGLGLFKDDPKRLSAAIEYLYRDRFAALGVTVEEYEPPCIIEADFRWPHAA